MFGVCRDATPPLRSIQQLKTKVALDIEQQQWQEPCGKDSLAWNILDWPTQTI